MVRSQKTAKNGRKTRKTSERREKNMGKEGRKHERRAERLQKTLKAVVTEIYYYVNYFAQRQQFCTNMCALQSRQLHTRSCLRSLTSYLVVLNRCGHWGVDTCVRRCSLSCIEFDVHVTSLHSSLISVSKMIEMEIFVMYCSLCASPSRHCRSRGFDKY